MNRSLYYKQNSLRNALYDQIQNNIDTEIDQKLIENPSPSRSLLRKQRYLKLICVSFLLSGFIYYRFIQTLSSSTRCIFDSYQQYTFDINRKLQAGWDNTIIGIGQVMMDGWIVATFLFWVFKIKNFRLPFAVAMFFGFRSLFLLAIKLPFPNNIVWHNPGFISLTVPYDHTRDFFYSGHTGSLTLILLQFSQLTIKHSHKIIGYIWIFTFFCLIYMMNMLIITRVHYTCDVIGGLVFSMYFYYVAGKFTIYSDKLVSLPYRYVIQPLIKRVRNKNKINKERKEGQKGQQQTNDASFDINATLATQKAIQNQHQTKYNPNNQ